ncbi:MAG: hypothetical protein KJ579_07430, partial [Verrucomicrobia bacterium]|nr:hypothetical protein [Verrucomicrobiota bacterium]
MKIAKALSRDEAREWAAQRHFRLPGRRRKNPWASITEGRSYDSECWIHAPGLYGPVLFCRDFLTSVPNWESLLVCPRTFRWPRNTKEDAAELYPDGLAVSLRTMLIGRIPSASGLFVRGGPTAASIWLLSALAMNICGQSDDLYVFDGSGRF